VLEQDARARKKVIGRERGEDDRVDVARGLARALEGHLRRFEREIARADAALFDVASLLDSRALLDPFITGRKELGQIVVGDDFGRDVVA
jgi:hypothetical protein